MSHVTYTPHSSEPQVPGERLGGLDVRKLLDAYAEREVQKIRWSAVVAGLFTALGTEILLSSLGCALGLITGTTGTQVLQGRFSTSAGIYTVFAALLATFVGGYTAAKLGGTIRQIDGALSGMLTWATSLALGLWMMQASLTIAAISSSNTSHLLRAAETATGESNAWLIFGSVALSLVAAVLGGAAGAVCTGRGGGLRGAHRREAQPYAQQAQEQAQGQDSIKL